MGRFGTARRASPKGVLLSAVIGGVLLMACAAASEAPGADALEAGFKNPPNAAKPRVWWHWMDGNVSRDGIQKDLAWLNRVGIGGVHNFDAALGGPGREAPALVDERIAYLTPQWRDTFRYAVGQAQQLGMEFTIAASPGWSESGGPWVKPAQGMKKLVWSETLIHGGSTAKPRVAAPPRITGPFQNVPFGGGIFAATEAPPEYYADIGVIAFPAARAEAAATKPAISTSSGTLEIERLSDGDLAKPVSLPYGSGDTDWIQFAYPKPQRLQSLTVAVQRPDFGTPSDMETGGAIRFEASDDGQSFRKVISVPRSGAIQQTISFAPVTARTFRLVLERPKPQPSVLDVLMGRQSPPPPQEHYILECAPHATARVHRFEDKAGFSTRAIPAGDDTPTIDGADALARNSVVDLTSKLRPDGTLDWTAPKGDWVVLRFGYSLTGRTNHPASKEGTGLEVDKLNREHVKSYFDAYFGEYAKTLDALSIGKQGLQFMLTDSYEAGISNWTDDMFEQFRTRRGYDAKLWLPVLAGRVVDSAAASDKFLWDYRQTLGDLIADAHYGQLSESLHAKGMKRYGESHENGRAFVGDGMQVKKSADVPMGALWASAPWAQRDSYDMDIRESASVAHIYGQNLVAAESLTAFGNTYSFTPEMLKPFADRELAMGLNRFVIHTSAHQPDDRPGPGATLGPFGQWFTRHETWSDFAAPWVSYLTRSAYLLQQGRFVADIAYLYGQDDNITNVFSRRKPVIPQGYAFDFVNADALVNVLSVKDGVLVTPSGMQYRLLALDPSTQRMSLPVLRKIAALVDAGAVVVGDRPAMTPSLADDAGEFDRLVEQVWGRGKASEGEALDTAMHRLGIAPDCTFGGDVDPELRYVHRRLAQGDVYFITNGTERARAIDASFRVSGLAPEIWRADSAEIRPASYRTDRGRTVVPLKLEPNGALFVVFRQPATAASLTVADAVTNKLADVRGPWDVTFQESRGAPAQARFDTLSSWTTSGEPGIRYFSGTATYATSFNAPRAWLGNSARVRIDLGDVKNIAEVAVNGKVAGVAWKAPFVVDVTEAIKAGSNRLEIKVTNLWPNRMIGDKQPGARQIAYATFDPFKADSPLLPAGLLGPVVLSRSTQP